MGGYGGKWKGGKWKGRKVEERGRKGGLEEHAEKYEEEEERWR